MTEKEGSVPQFPHPPNLEQLKKQARDLLDAYRAGQPDARRRIETYLPRIGVSGSTQGATSTVLLAHALFVVAREQGFPSWPKLKASSEAMAQRTERALDEATRVAVPAGREARTAFARERASAAGLLARRQDVERLPRCLTSMALRDMLAVRSLLWENGDFSRVVDTLILGLEHPQPAVRYCCAGALDHFGDERCVEPLRRLVADPVPRVRRVALHALGCDACKLMPWPRDCDAIVLFIDRALNDTSITVRRHAASELDRYGHDPRVMGALRLLADRESDPAILRGVDRALRRHGRTAPA